MSSPNELGRMNGSNSPGRLDLDSMIRTKRFRTRARYCARTTHDFSEPRPFVNFTLSDINHVENRGAVCIIENITPEWIRELGVAFNIPEAFFFEHSTNPGQEYLWDTVFTRSADPTWEPAPDGTTRSWQIVQGIYEYHGWKAAVEDPHDFNRPHLLSDANYFQRHYWEGPSPYPVSNNTKISYYRATANLYIFLVDKPLQLEPGLFTRINKKRTTLRLPYSCNRGGLLLPQLFSENDYSLFNSLTSFFQHGWHFNLLFPPHLNDMHVLGPGELLYTLSSSLWQSNYRYLEKTIRKVSFEDIREPSVKTNSALHDLREDLVYLKDGLMETQAYVPDYVKEYFHDHYDNGKQRQLLNQESPVERHSSMLRDVFELQSFLMDTFSLLVSTIGVLDSQTSLEQNRRGSRLTQLAFIYVPLSFVTGIYGMNVAEINGSPLSVWVCFVTLAVVGLATAILFLSYEKVDKQRKIKKAEACSQAQLTENQPQRTASTSGKLWVKSVCSYLPVASPSKRWQWREDRRIYKE